MLKVAIQKSGRLSDKSLSLLKECGIQVNNGNNKLKAVASNFPMEVLFLRDDDIPQYVHDGVADIGILGENVVLEKGKDLETIEKLDFGKCRLSLAVPREVEDLSVEYFQGKRIATSYPKILGDFLKAQGVSAQIEEISGSVEIAPGIGLADGVCDIVSTGSTLLTNGLKETQVVMKSQAVLVSNGKLTAEKAELLDKLRFRVQAVMNARQNKYILMNAPDAAIDDIVNLLPGMKSPTILPLATEGWSSLHSVVPEDKFWEVIDKLRALGAQGILVVPIEKMVL